MTHFNPSTSFKQSNNIFTNDFKTKQWIRKVSKFYFEKTNGKNTTTARELIENINARLIRCLHFFPTL